MDLPAHVVGIRGSFVILVVLTMSQRKRKAMKIFLLKQIEGADWDEYNGKVIVAKDEARAREIANADVGDEGKIWDNPQKVSCVVVDKTVEGVVLDDFKAG